ncbi:MAG: exodeoxyribonuclease VII large subunit [Candidatus Andersenbacteria bacterium]
MPALTVTQLIEAINATLSALEDVVVEGEIDEFKIIHNKWVTFQLKDEHSSIGCFLTVWQYKTQVEDGMLVRATGRPTLRNKGFFSFVVTNLQPAGEGALKRAFELLRTKLMQEGLFAAERKRPLPRFPEHIALITSRDAAAYSDFLKVLGARQGGLQISFLHTQVQGQDAPPQLVAALEHANTHLNDLDAIVIVRGGGSLEDLQAFNDETVIRAVAASRTPIIVGVGHERDSTLAELAADLRASTPSNAAELLVRSREELLLAIRHLHNSLAGQLHEHLQQQRQVIAAAVSILRTRTAVPQQRVQRQLESLSAMRQRLRQTITTRTGETTRIRHLLHEAFHEKLKQQYITMNQLTRMLRSLSPEKTLKRGYTITRNQRGVVIKSARHVVAGEEIATQFTDGSITSRVHGTDHQKALAL